MQRIELGTIGLLLCEQTRDPRERLGKVRRKAGTVGDLAANVAGDATEKGLQPPDLTSRTPHLPRVGIAIGQAQRALAQPVIALPLCRSLTLYLAASRTSISRPRW